MSEARAFRVEVFNLLTPDLLQIDQLWEALGGCTEACLRWLRLAADSGGVFDEEVLFLSIIGP